MYVGGVGSWGRIGGGVEEGFGGRWLMGMCYLEGLEKKAGVVRDNWRSVSINFIEEVLIGIESRDWGVKNGGYRYRV
jgi:hypothetical protein